jgi:hypothetical protein
VPTEYQDAFPKQTRDFGALIKYLQPAGIRRQLSETLKDYNTWEFERDEEWDEDTRTTALKAHENAFRVLRTLFNDLRSFGDKKAAKAFLAEAYENGDSGESERLLDELVRDSEEKLKYTAGNDYTEWHEARTLAKLRAKIDPLMTSNGTFEQPALWPLAQQVW